MNTFVTYWNGLVQTLRGIDWDTFHFLRPRFLLLFYPAFIIVLLLIFGNRQRRKWKNIISSALRPFMFSKSNPWAILLPLLAFIIGISSIIVALSGPAWKKIQIPGAKTNAVLLIGMDLSESMLATDIQPNRLERAKLKLTDLLNANPRTRVGLLAMAGTTHPVLPFCSDYKIIEQQATALVPRVMPVAGRNMDIFMTVVDTFMYPVEAPSTLLLITDQIHEEDVKLLKRFADSTIHRVEILLVATDKGAAIPGQHLISKPDTALLRNLAENKKIIVNAITLDKSDVEAIAKRVSDKLVFTLENKQLENVWDDKGSIFLIPALLIGAFWFRKGWVIQWCWLPLFFMGVSCKPENKKADWWYSKDYQAQAYYKDGKFEKAAELFQDPAHKAAAYFRNGDFQTAADLLEEDTTSIGKFNRAMALANLGQFELSDSLLKQVEQLDPALAANAAGQRKKIVGILAAIDSLNQKQDAIEEIAGKKPDKKNGLHERKPQTEDEKLSADTKVKKLPTTGDRVSDDVASNQHKFKEAKFPPKDFKLQKPDQSGDIMMQKANADPQEFLKRRFEIQRMKYYKNIRS